MENISRWRLLTADYPIVLSNDERTKPIIDALKRTDTATKEDMFVPAAKGRKPVQRRKIIA